MSETTIEKQPESGAPAEAKPEATQTTTEPQAVPQDKVNELLAEQKRKLREQYGDYDDLKQKAAKLAEIEEQSKTEQQRAAEAAARALKDAEDARTETLRYKAAATHGVDPDNFDLLGSGTEEEVSARAERVGGFLKLRTENEQLKAELEALKAGKPAPSSQRPAAALKPGATAEQITPAEDDSYPTHWLPPRQQ